MARETSFASQLPALVAELTTDPHQLRYTCPRCAAQFITTTLVNPTAPCPHCFKTNRVPLGAGS